MNRWLGGLLLATLCILPGAASSQLLRDVAPTMPSLREALALPTDKASRHEISIVGSTSMSFYTDAVVRDLVAKTGIAPPIVRGTGTREGIRAFCAGRGTAFPDIVAASRRMTTSEFNACVDNGIVDIIELAIGLDAIVIVTEKGEPVFNLTPRHFYLALAAEVPRRFVMTANVSHQIAEAATQAVGEDFVDNPFTRWSEIDSSLPDTPIQVYGPSVDSGTRDFINGQVLEAGCRNFKPIKDIYGAADRVRQCTTLRAAPYFNEVEEPFENKVIAAVLADGVGTLGLVTFDTFEREQKRVEPLPMLGRLATAETIANGEYPLRRRVYYYVKRAHMRDSRGVGVVVGLREFMADLTREEVIGPGGLLDKIGLVPLGVDDRARARRDAGTLRRMDR